MGRLGPGRDLAALGFQGSGLAGGKGKSWGWVRTKTEGEATTLLDPRRPGFCSALLWLSGSFPRYSCI